MNWESYSFIMPARIVEYDAGNQTATVSVATKRVYSTSLVTDEQTDFGDLYIVPVHTLSGGSYAVTMPIQPGDSCLMLFSQFGYDHWLFNNKDDAGTVALDPPPWVNRKFSLQDGLCLVGFNTIPNAITDYSPEHAEFRNRLRTQYISLNSGGDIDIVGPAAGSLTLAGEYAVTAPTTAWTGDVAVDGELDMLGNAIVNVATPASATDAANKSYVDAISNAAISATDFADFQSKVMGLG